MNELELLRKELEQAKADAVAALVHGNVQDWTAVQIIRAKARMADQIIDRINELVHYKEEQ